MYIYSLTYFINSVGFFMAKKDRRLIKVVVVSLLIFISGTRYYMGGSDVYVYESFYNSVPSIKSILIYFFSGINYGINQNYEVGFLLISSLIKTLHFSYFGFVLIYTFMFYALVLKGLKDFVPNWSIFFAFFMYKIMFYNTFISIRQGLTIAIFCYSLRFIRDKKWHVYFPLALTAFFVHRGALVLLPVYFIQYIPLSKKFIRNYALFFLPTILISNHVNLSVFLDSLINFIGFANKSKGWADKTEPINIIHTIECYIVVFLILIFYEKLISNKREKEVKLILKLILLAIPIFTLFRDWIVLTRVKDYFIIFYGVILGYVLDEDSNFVAELENKESVQNISKPIVSNSYLISLIIILACFIGMMRYAFVFNGGELKYFNSFIFESVSIFQ